VENTISAIEERTEALESWERTDLIRDTAGYLAEYLNTRPDGNTRDAFHARETIAKLLELFEQSAVLELS
jgi:hypothetical protein